MPKTSIVGARVLEDRVEYDLGQVSDISDWLGITLIVAYAVAFAGLADFVFHRGVWTIAVSIACVAALHAARWFLRRRGDHLVIAIARKPGSTPEHVFEVRYRDAVVTSGAFSPEQLGVDTIWQARGPPGMRPMRVYRLFFRPDPPATAVHPRYANGIPVFEDPQPTRCTDQLVALLEALKIDPADVLVRIREQA